jgi:hypothetical protein
MPNVVEPKRTPNHAMAFGSSFTIEIVPLQEALDVVLPSRRREPPAGATSLR